LLQAKQAASSIIAALEAAQSRYIARNPHSLALHQSALLSLPGGNTRSLLWTSPFPITVRSGKGYQVTDEDGHTYTDFVGELTAGLFGHSHPLLRETIVKTLDDVGMNLGATIQAEQKHAKLICERFALQRVRFTNSGTEANLHALAAARRFTGRSKVVVFKGGYHGAVLSFGSGIAENNVDKGDFIVATYNDVVSARKAIEGAEGVAAVLVEGMQGAGGSIPGSRSFLESVQASAKKVGAVFILDEVMTSRLAPGGLASVLGLEPDLKSLGKYLGGGISFGAFGGRQDIMAVYDPRNPNGLMHSGTFNNNSLGMHCGYVALSEIYTPDVCTAFSAMGNAFREQLQRVSRGTKMTFTGLGTLITLHISETGIEDVKSIDDIQQLQDLKDLFWLEMAEEDFWTNRRGSINLMLGIPQSELDRFVGAVSRFLQRHSKVMGLNAGATRARL